MMSMVMKTKLRVAKDELSLESTGELEMRSGLYASRFQNSAKSQDHAR